MTRSPATIDIGNVMINVQVDTSIRNVQLHIIPQTIPIPEITVIKIRKPVIVARVSLVFSFIFRYRWLILQS